MPAIPKTPLHQRLALPSAKLELLREQLEQLDAGTSENLKGLTQVIDTKLSCIVDEIRRLGHGAEISMDDDLGRACEFLACGVDPKKLGFLRTHEWTSALHAAGCKNLHHIAAEGSDASHACDHIWATWPESAHHQRPSRRCLHIICAAARYIASRHAIS